MTDRKEIEHLIEQVAFGNRNAFSSLYDATSTKLFSVCLRVLKSREAAEDALQDVFIKVWRNADKYHANGLSPMTWLITIARNTSIDRLRSEHEAYEGDVSDLICEAPGPEQKSIEGSEKTQIERCLNTLQEDKADAVRAAYLEGETYVDLAERFNVPLNTMRTWLRRSLIALKGCMNI